MNSLLLIPDISGFTQFVSQTESEHGRHIVAELLELLIDSNSLDMTVSEIEGDAVMFYLKDRVPEVTEIQETVQRMFVNFHTHLVQYESKRICNCGACSSAAELTLKVVAHSGKLDFLQIKDFLKPYGKDMIIVHRLLKNDVPDDEYLLVTEGLSERPPVDSGDWTFESGCSSYDELGDVPYQYASLTPFRQQIPEPPDVVDFPRMPNPVAESVHVRLSVTDTYELISNLDVRLTWTDGPTRLDFEADRVNRVGTRHQCVVRGDLIDFETITADYGPRKLVYGERLDDPPFVEEMAFFYVLSAEGEGTGVTIEVHYRPKPFPVSLMEPLVRFGSRRLLKKTLSGLKGVAESGLDSTAW